MSIVNFIRMSYKKQEVITFRKHLSSHVSFCGVRGAHFVLRFACVVLLCVVYVLSSMLWCALRFPYKNDVRFVKLFVGGLMSYCLFTYSSVQLILCCVFALFFFVLYTLYFEFLWIIHSWLPVFSNVYIKTVCIWVI